MTSSDGPFGVHLTASVRQHSRTRMAHGLLAQGMVKQREGYHRFHKGTARGKTQDHADPDP